MLRRATRSLAPLWASSGGASAQEQSVAQLQLRIDQLEQRMRASNVTSATTGGERNPNQELYEFAARQPKRAITFQRLNTLETDRDLISMAPWASREMMIRLAHAAAELAFAPFGLGQMGPIRELRTLHELSFQDMRQMPQSFDEASVVQLCQTFEKIHQRHHQTTELIAQGVQEFIQRNHMVADIQLNPATEQELYNEYAELQDYLHDVAVNRTKARFIISHYVAAARKVMPRYNTTEPQMEEYNSSEQNFGLDDSSFVGNICAETNMHKVVQSAVASATKLMSMNGEVTAPDVELHVHGDENFTFKYVPMQAHNICTALISHAMKLSMRRGKLQVEQPEPLHVLVSQVEGNSDVVVRVVDTAGGIALGMAEHSQSFLYSALQTETLNLKHDDEPMAWMKSALRVPYARVCAQVFGGDVHILPVDGLGTSMCYSAPTSGLETTRF